MNNRTWIKKKQDQHQFISSKSCDLLVTMMLKEKMYTVGLSDWAHDWQPDIFASE